MHDDDAESICSLPIDEYENSSNIGKISVSVNEYDSVRIELPNLLWNGYYNNIKSFFLSKSGDTVTLSGEWEKGRPFLCGGPLNGAYLFSEIHFHIPSEHLLNEKRYPMEMHAVHYKSSYLTGERALKEKDGTLVVVYLFEVGDTNETAISRITNTLLKAKYLNNFSKAELNICSLAELVKHFYTNYFIYTGKGSTHDHAFELQWIISCQRFIITKKELNDMKCYLQYERTCELPRTVVKVKDLFLVGDTIVQDDMEMRKKSQIQFVECKTKEKAKSCTNINTERRSECSSKKRKNLVANETCTEQKSTYFVGNDKITLCSENKYTQTSGIFLIACKSVQISSDAKKYDEDVGFIGEQENNEILAKGSSELEKHEYAAEKSNEIEARKQKKATGNEEDIKNVGQKHRESAQILDKSKGRTNTFGEIVREKSEKADKTKKDKPASEKIKYKVVKEKISEKVKEPKVKKETINKAKTRKKNTKLKQEQRTKHEYDAKEGKKKLVEGSNTINIIKTKKSKGSKSDNDSESGLECISSESSMDFNSKMKSVQCFTSLTDHRQFPAERTKSRTSYSVYLSDSDLDTITFGISNSELDLKNNQITLCNACTSTNLIPFPEYKISNFSESVNTEIALLVNVFPNLNEEKQNFDRGRQQECSTMVLVLNHQMNASRLFYATCFSFIQILARIEQEIRVDLAEHEIKYSENSTLHKMKKNHFQKSYWLEKNIGKNMKIPLDIQIKEKKNETVSVIANSNNDQDFRRLPEQATEKFHVNFSTIPPLLTNNLHSIGLIIDSEMPETEKIHRQKGLNESIKSRSSAEIRASEDEVYINWDRAKETEGRNGEKQRVFAKSKLNKITNESRTNFVRLGNVKEIISKIPIVSEKPQITYYPAKLEKHIVTDDGQKNFGQQNAKRKAKNRNECYSDDGSKYSHSANLFQFEEPEGNTNNEDDRKNIIIPKQANEIKGIEHKHWSLINLPPLDESKDIGSANEKNGLSLGLPTGNKGKSENRSEKTATQNLTISEREETVKSANVIPGSSLKLRFLPKGSSFLRDINVEVEDCLVRFDSKESIEQIFIETRLLIEQKEKDRKVIEVMEGNKSSTSQPVLSQIDKKLDNPLPCLSFSFPKMLESCNTGKNPGKSESVINSNRPMYFISDRLETDPITGKKIFIGSFTLK